MTLLLLGLALLALLWLAFQLGKSRQYNKHLTLLNDACESAWRMGYHAAEIANAREVSEHVQAQWDAARQGWQ